MVKLPDCQLIVESGVVDVRVPPELERLGVTDRDDLGRLVADSLAWTSAEVSSVQVVPVPYDIPALTTLSRDRVQGVAASPAGQVERFSIFVKVLRSWELTPEYAFVPPDFRAEAARLLAWEVEPEVYRSRLAEALPDGLAMPRCFAVRDLSVKTAAVWVEDVPVVEADWSLAQLHEAARLLARFAVDPRARESLAPMDRWLVARSLRGYADGRLRHQVLPLLRSDDLWRRPLIIRHFETLRGRLTAAADQVPTMVDELEAAPAGLAHGDASTRNLLPTAESLVMIDFGFLSRAPLGFDLAQLAVGAVQVGDQDLDDLAAAADATLAGYAEGLREAGAALDVDRLRRIRALVLTLFSGLSAIPFDRIEPFNRSGPSDDDDRVFARQATICAWILDELDRTAEQSETSVRRQPGRAGGSAAE